VDNAAGAVGVAAAVTDVGRAAVDAAAVAVAAVVGRKE